MRLLWILLSVKKQMVEALEEEIPAHQETDCVLETALVPSVGNEIRWNVMDTCAGGWREGQH